MIRVAVISDTHSNIAKICDAIRIEQPDMIIHLGDYDKDAAAIYAMFPDIPMHSVCGNCDVTPVAPVEKTIIIGTLTVFMTHGHMYDVRWSTDRLVYAAMAAEAKIAMYGHTHIPDYSEVGNVTVLNPGTAGQGNKRTWALVTVYENGGYTCEIRDL